MFPKSLGEILEVHEVSELHLTLTQSAWRHREWASLGGAGADAPPGAELWVWFAPRSQDSRPEPEYALCSPHSYSLRIFLLCFPYNLIF